MNAPKPMLAKVYKYAYQLKASGKTAAEIADELLAKGIDNKSSSIIAQNIDKSYTEANAKQRRKYIAYGLLWICAGLAIISLTYFDNLHNSGYPYFIGSVAFLLGISRLALTMLQNKQSSH